jgi:hypothetical protein
MRWFLRLSSGACASEAIVPAPADAGAEGEVWAPALAHARTKQIDGRTRMPGL